MVPAPVTSPKRPRRLRDRRLWIAVFAILIIAAVFTLRTRISWTHLHTTLLNLSPTATIATMAVLPLFGFSIVAVDVITGAKFGFWVGSAVIAGVTAFHLLASYAIARGFLRAPLQRWLARHRERIPHMAASDEIALTLLIALVPGPPYFARNYMLALSEVPLRLYFWIVTPLYLARALVTLAVGDLTGSVSRSKLLILGSVYVVKLIVTVVVVKRLLGKYKLSAPFPRESSSVDGGQS
jgi:uncharacterized membrane protein YdjX (TVP38/TMEM64 family)